MTTFYSTFSTQEGLKAAYIYKTKKQLIAADFWDVFKPMQEVEHFSTNAGINAVKAHLEKEGYKVLRPVAPAYDDGSDFWMPFPGKEYFCRPCCYC